jgi:sensor histidine kinase regulating citrate/malate metabolism
MRRWSLARQLFVLQAVIVLAVVLCGALIAYGDARTRTEDNTTREVTALARTIAAAPSVLTALDTANPSTQLQPYAEQVRHSTGVDFVTIMDPRGIRYTHPNPAQIGEHFLGHIGPALGGQTFTETYTGTLGPSVRAVTPVRDGTGTVRALVSVGITVEAIDAQMRTQLLGLAGIAALALLIGGAATYTVAVRLRRHTHGMSAEELGRLFEYHEATLHAVREGLLLLDGHGVVHLANDGARDLLAVQDAVGRTLPDLGLPQSLAGQEVRDELRLTEDRVLVVNSSPVRKGERLLGTVVTLRDHTDLQQLTGELDSVRGLAESLRSQAHEAANRLHTVISLVELGRPEQAVEFATTELELAQRLTDTVVAAVEEPVLAALLLGKAAQASERGVELDVTPQSRIDDGALTGVDQHDLVTVLGNLLDNAIDAAVPTSSPRVRVTVSAGRDALLVAVSDSGRGLEASDVDSAFRRGWSTKDGAGRGLGLALVGQVVRRHRGTIEVDGSTFTVRMPLR